MGVGDVIKKKSVSSVIKLSIKTCMYACVCMYSCMYVTHIKLLNEAAFHLNDVIQSWHTFKPIIINILAEMPEEILQVFRLKIIAEPP